MTSEPFAESAAARVRAYMERVGEDGAKVQALTPDASAREYFRVPWGPGTALVAAYPEPFDAATQPFLDVTRLFQTAQLPVPDIYEVAAQTGLVIQEDCGDCQLAAFYRTASEEALEDYREQAIGLIARIQGATQLARESGSCAGLLAFDEAKLGWELNFFQEHFFGSLRKEKLSYRESEQIGDELKELSVELAARPQVLCHRDFHAGNLLVDRKGRLRIIDYQDARLGPATYDLVSLLLDRVLLPPSLAELRAGRLALLEERVKIGLPALDCEELAWEFRLMSVQRVLKAVGTFSYQTGVRGRGALYAHYIQPMLQVVLQALTWLGRWPVLRKILQERATQSYL